MESSLLTLWNLLDIFSSHTNSYYRYQDIFLYVSFFCVQLELTYYANLVMSNVVFH